MKDEIKILILSCGTRNKLVQYFKREIDDRGLIMAADCSELAPALYDVDKYFVVPSMTENKYIDVIFSICKEYHISAILSLVDPELSLLAKHKLDFLNIGTIPIVSDYETVEMCLDKYSMYEFLIQKGFKTARSYIEKDIFYRDVELGIINYPAFIKPVKGSASINTNTVSSAEEIELIVRNSNSNIMIQEFMSGVEYGADVYIDMISGEIVSIFIKEKIKMRAGETDKSVSIRDDRLFEIITSLVYKLGLKGVIDIDIYKVKDEYFIGEVNPRFGGGYPHAYECGENFPRMIINNLSGHVNRPEIGKYEEGVFMMKYNELKIIRPSELLKCTY